MNWRVCSGTRTRKALSKLRNTRQQARLSHAQRAQNLQGSIAVRGDVRGRNILLVDDVYTTGATMRVCAQALLEAGAEGCLWACLRLCWALAPPRLSLGTPGRL